LHVEHEVLGAVDVSSRVGGGTGINAVVCGGDGTDLDAVVSHQLYPLPFFL
jgi:hypothetical protein